MNFLQIAQALARESGTVSGTRPTSVANQTGDMLRIVNWAAEAWTLIQNLHAGWKFLRAEIDPSTALTTASTQRYTAASWNIDDHAEWINEDHLMTLYLVSTGVSDEREIEWIPWADFRRLWLRGTQTTDRPTQWSVSPDNEICFGHIPDATYAANGEYRRTAQVLTAGGDTPILPVRFHNIIVWRGLMLLVEHDEAPANLMTTARAKYGEYLSNLRRDQLPMVTANAAGPLA